MAWFACRIVVVSKVAMAPAKALAQVKVMAWVPVAALAMVLVMVHARPPDLPWHGRGERHARHHHHRNQLLRRLRTTGGQTGLDHSMNRIRSNRVLRRLGEDVDLDKTWLS